MFDQGNRGMAALFFQVNNIPILNHHLTNNTQQTTHISTHTPDNIHISSHIITHIHTHTHTRKGMKIQIASLFGITLLLFIAAMEIQTAKAAWSSQVTLNQLYPEAFNPAGIIKMKLAKDGIWALDQDKNIWYCNETKMTTASEWKMVFAEPSRSNKYAGLTAGGTSGDVCVIDDTTGDVRCAYRGTGPIHEGIPQSGSSIGTWHVIPSPGLTNVVFVDYIDIDAIAAGKMVCTDWDNNSYLWMGNVTGWVQIGNPSSGSPRLTKLAICADGEIFGLTNSDSKMYRALSNGVWETKATRALTEIDCGATINEVVTLDGSAGTVYKYNYAAAPSAGTYTDWGGSSIRTVTMYGGKTFAASGKVIYKRV